MFNITILSLTALSQVSSSPFYTIHHSHQGMFRSTFVNSHFSKSFTSIFVSYTYKHQTTFHNSVFSHTLDSAIMFTIAETAKCMLFENEDYVPGSKIENKIIYGDNFTDGFDRPTFNNNCGNIIITGCEFHNCHSKNEGGSLHIQQECTVLIHNTIFANSSTESRYGGAAYIVKQKLTPDNSFDFSDGQISQADIQYCCFQDCYGDNSNLYGVALLIAGENTILYYASTVNCPGIGNERKTVEGAQFDIQSTNVTSKYVNATGGRSSYCAGIEYRLSQEGFFRFQTISNMECTFSIAFTEINISGLDLSTSNIYNITLHRSNTANNQPFSGLIHVRKTDSITLSDFCFTNIIFNNENDNSRIISKGNGQDIAVTLINCTFECGIDRIEYTYVGALKTCQLIGCETNKATLNEIPQLNLGECKGKVTPAPLIPPTNMFTNSKDFSKSDEFSKSKIFSKSNTFSVSNEFTHSDLFKPAENPDNSNKGNNKNVGMIAGVTAAVAAAAVIAAVVAFFLFRRKRLNMMISSDIETITDSNNSIKNENPIYDEKAADDPFKEDF